MIFTRSFLLVSARTTAKRLCRGTSGLLLLLAFTLPASAVDFLYGSGQNADLSSTFQRDSNWNIVAWPSNWSNGPIPTAPYQAYVPRTVPGPWYGGNTGTNGSQGGFQPNGDPNHYYWISPTSTDASIASGSYNWIAAQTFNITQAGTYTFNFPASGDNGIRFYVDGTVDTSNPITPVITGGTQVGGYSDNFTNIYNYTGDVSLSAGQHTAYMVLFDFGGSTGALIGQSTFTAVPEPSTYALAAIATGMMTMIARRRKARKLA